MDVGIILLLIVSIPRIGVFVRIRRVPPTILAPDHGAGHAVLLPPDEHAAVAPRAGDRTTETLAAAPLDDFEHAFDTNHAS